MKKIIIAIMVVMVGFGLGCEETVDEPNHAPDITSLTVSHANPVFGDTLTLTVVATDPDGDVITYSWSEENGLGTFLTTDDSTVRWVANFALPASAIFNVQVSDGDLITKSSAGVAVTSADLAEVSYVGSSTCGQCHSAIYADFRESGHPYKFNLIKNSQAPSYPDVVINFRDTEWPPAGATWDDIEGVIGGFGWKARFVDKTGHIVGTADADVNPGAGQNQFNFYGGTNHGWKDYHPTDSKPYNQGCFRCHTTGATVNGEWKPGIEGTFVYGGVQCEGCHGPGSEHVEAGGGAVNIDSFSGEEVNDLCGQCHYRNSDHSVATSGGYIRHHEQYDEFIHTKHYDSGQNCSTCHDPHKRVVWDGDGVITECTSCHGTQTPASPHNAVDCTSCHMAKLAKSAIATVDGYQGDVHSHTFAVAADTSWDMIDGSVMRLDADGHTKLTLANVCYGCHADEAGGGGTGSTKTLGALNDYTASIHP